jgi:vacuolar protein sorting-associated protein 54
LDLTDLTLFKEISDRWPLFFSATKDLSGLRSDIGNSRSLAKSLIATHERTQARFLTRSLRLLYCSQRLKRLEAVEEKLELLAAVRQAQPTVQQLLSSAMYAGALEIIGKTQKTIAVKLHGLVCVKHENKQLDGMGEVVAKMIGGEFIKQTSGYIIQGVFQHKDSLIELIRIGHSSLDGIRKLFTSDDDFSRVEAIIDTVATRNALLEQLSLLRPVLEAQLKTELRDVMTALGLRTDKVHWETLTREQFVGMMRTFGPIVEQVLVRLSTFGLAIFRRLPALEIDWNQTYLAIKSAIVSYKDGEEHQRRSIVSECNHLENVLVSRFLSKAIKGLKSPAGRLVALPISEIAEIYESIHALQSVVSRYVDQRGAPLLLAYQQSEKEFLQVFHDRKMKEIIALLDGETWTNIPIPEEFLQQMTQRRSEVSSTPLPITVKAVSCLLMFYKVVYEYLRICQELHLPTETGSRLIDLFKLFNSKVCQLVLGAGATALGHLKTINSKHLGLSAQCISFLLEELPYIEVRLETSVPDYRALLAADIARLKIDLSMHLQEVYTKLGRILNDRITQKCEMAVKDVKWELMLSQNKLEKDYYAQQIVNDMTGMHTILEGILSPEQLLLVFGPILHHLTVSLRDLYHKAPVISPVSAQRVRNDTQFFLFNAKKLSSILQSAVRELETELETVVLERCVPLLTPAAS